MSDDASICPHCKKGKMQERSIIFGVGTPDEGDRTELICDLCRHRMIKADFNPHVNVSDSIKEEKNPK